MGDLRDALVKAGLVATPAVEAVEAPRGAPPARTPSAPPVPADPGERLRRAKQLVRAGKLGGKHKGARRWYYTRGDDAVRYADLDAATVAQLERGDAGLVEDPTGTLAVLDTAACSELEALEPAWIVAWNKNGG